MSTIASDHHVAPAGFVVEQRFSSIRSKRKARLPVDNATDSGKRARIVPVQEKGAALVAARHPLLTDKIINRIQKLVNKLFKLEEENEDNRCNVLPTIIQKACGYNEELFGNELLAQQLLEIGNKEFDKLKEQAAIIIPAKKTSRQAQKITALKNNKITIDPAGYEASIIEHSKITEAVIKKVKEYVVELFASTGKGPTEDLTVSFTKLAKKIAIDFEDETELLTDKDFINGVKKIAKEEYQLLKEKESKEVIESTPKSGTLATTGSVRTVLEEFDDAFPMKFYNNDHPSHFSADHYSFFTSYAFKIFNPNIHQQDTINYDDLFGELIKKFPNDFPELSDSDPTKRKTARIFYQHKIEDIILWRFQSFYSANTGSKTTTNSLTDWQLVRFHECLYKHKTEKGFNMRAMKNEIAKEFPTWFKKFTKVGEESTKEQDRFTQFVKSHLGVAGRTVKKWNKFAKSRELRLERVLKLRREGKLTEENDPSKIHLSCADAAVASAKENFVDLGHSWWTEEFAAAAAPAAPSWDESDVAPIGIL